MRAPPTRRDAARRPGEDGRGDETSADASSLDESATPMQANAALFEALPQAHFAALSRLLGEATDWLVLLQVRALRRPRPRSVAPCCEF